MARYLLSSVPLISLPMMMSARTFSDASRSVIRLPRPLSDVTLASSGSITPIASWSSALSERIVSLVRSMTAAAVLESRSLASAG